MRGPIVDPVEIPEQVFDFLFGNADALIPWMPLIKFSMPDKVETFAE